MLEKPVTLKNLLEMALPRKRMNKCHSSKSELTSNSCNTTASGV
jgi:hypothetical protein